MEEDRRGGMCNRFCTFGNIVTEFVCNWYKIQHSSLLLLLEVLIDRTC